MISLPHKDMTMRKRNRRNRNKNTPISKVHKPHSVFTKKDSVSLIYEDQIAEGRKMMERERLENEKH
jgi:hypothetical protein